MRWPAPEQLTAEAGTQLELTCQACGQSPARQVEFRRHTGMLLVWRHESIAATMCRHCGVGVFRKFMDHTLYAGWWGLIAFFSNFYAIGVNLVNRRKLQSLAPPLVQPEGAPG